MGYTEPEFNGAEYANVIAKLLPEAQTAGIPLGNIYIAAFGKHWVSKMYEAQSKLKTEVEGWYFHPYGPPNGSSEENSQGIQSLPNVQTEMTSGQNNIIVSEVGYWTHDVNGGESKGGPSSVWAENSTQAAQWLTEMLGNALPYRQAGWLRALLVYSRNDGGWAMELPGSALTKQGEALDNFANVYGLAFWWVQPTPNPTEATHSTLGGVSCPTSSACVTVGRYSTGTIPSSPHAFAEVWNGSWAMQPVSNPTGATASVLSGVSCTSSSACIAVGSYVNSSGVSVTLAETWNGSSWSVQSTPNPTEAKGSFLNSVSCTSPSACIAVGEYQYTTGLSSSTHAFAEVWNGSSWSVQSTPNPPGATWSVLSGVSCTSSTTCTAVGSYVNSSGVEVTLAEVWTGSSWSIQSTPNPSDATASIQSGVACASATFCTAVGDYSHVVALLNTVSTLAESYH